MPLRVRITHQLDHTALFDDKGHLPTHILHQQPDVWLVSYDEQCLRIFILLQKLEIALIAAIWRDRFTDFQRCVWEELRDGFNRLECPCRWRTDKMTNGLSMEKIPHKVRDLFALGFSFFAKWA